MQRPSLTDCEPKDTIFTITTAQICTALMGFRPPSTNLATYTTIISIEGKKNTTEWFKAEFMQKDGMYSCLEGDVGAEERP